MNRFMRASRVIWLIAGLFCLSVASVAIWLVDEFQNEALMAARHQVERQSRGAETSLNRTFIAIDLTLAALETMPGLFVENSKQLDLAKAPAVLRALIDQHLLVRDLILLDSDGQVLAAAEESTTRLGLPLPEPFFSRVRSLQAAQLSISVPAASLSTREKVIFFARPIGAPGAGRRIAVATVPVMALTTIMAPAVDIAGLSIALERSDGILLASVPANDSMLGRLHAHAPEVARLSQAAGMAEGRLNAGPALTSVRPTVYASVLVSAAVTEAAIQARWHEPALMTVALAGLFVVLAVVVGAMSQAYLARLKAVGVETTNAKFVLEEALASMEEGFLLWGRDERVIAWNERYLDMFPHLRGALAPGISRAELAEIAARAMLPGGSDAQRQAWIAERLSTRGGTGGALEQHLPNGRTISVAERRTATGSTVAIYHDVTDARGTARGLQEARRAAEAANEAKTRFLATMSHEIRTPLNGVLGMNSLLLATDLSEKQRMYADIIRSSGDSLLTIINDILDMSRLEAGHVSIELAAFEPARLLDDVTSLLESRAHEGAISLRVEHDPGLPAVLLGDARRLRQVLFNLIGNAIKFTEQGGVVVESSHALLDDDRIEWTLCVRDTGIGIEAHVIPSLFDRFTQADTSTSRRFGGSGLGLAISRELVELMHGRIRIDSRIGKGSEVRMSIPLDRAPQGVDRDVIKSRQAFSPDRHLHILVAEDNQVNQIVISAMLHQMGHVVDVVSDGFEAVACIRQAQYDLVLMDIQMPRMDGVAATRAIRQLSGASGQVPIIAVSANALAEQRLSYLAAGMNDHLSKPIDQAMLVQVIATAVGWH